MVTMRNSKNIAIIPARGGSKRLPRKNILELNGRPLISYVIEAAIDSKLFNSVFVSTEDDEIKAIAMKFGALIIDRPAHLAQDSSSMSEVCLDLLQEELADNICCLYATAALLSTETIKKSFLEFRKNPHTQYLMGVSRYNYNPVQALTQDEGGNLAYMFPQFTGIQSQNFPELVVSNGTFIWAKSKAFLEEKTFYGKGLRGFLLPEWEVCDIDTHHDYEKLKNKFHNRKKEA